MNCGTCEVKVDPEKCAVFCPDCSKALLDERARMEKELEMARTWAKIWHNATQKAKAK